MIRQHFTDGAMFSKREKDVFGIITVIHPLARDLFDHGIYNGDLRIAHGGVKIDAVHVGGQTVGQINVHHPKGHNRFKPCI